MSKFATPSPYYKIKQKGLKVMGKKENPLGEAIRSAREKKGYSQEQLAELVEISLGHMQHIEAGRRKPSVPVLIQLMKLLDFSVDAVVFPGRAEDKVLRMDGLTEKETEALSRLVDAMREK